ncbi:MAG: hypothetical protein V4583_19690 [Pseudomonadota bacterium]
MNKTIENLLISGTDSWNLQRNVGAELETLMVAEDSESTGISMSQYLWDTFDFLIPITMFLVSFICFAVVIASARYRKLTLSPIAPAGSSFMLSYISALGGKYSLWPSLLLIIVALAFQGFSIGKRIEFDRLAKQYSWQVITFCSVYVVCTNYFLRAFQP